MRTTRTTAAAVAAVGVLALAVPALAQDDTPGQEATEGTSEAEPGADDAPAERKAAVREEFAAALAEELGLETDEVADAIDVVRERFAAERRAEVLERLEQRLAAAVEDDRITQAQADAILAAAEAGELPRGLGRHRGPRGHHGPRWAPDGAGSTDTGDAAVEGSSA